MARISDLLQGFDGRNPFRDRKSSSFGDSRIASEFSPTSKFWSLLNEQHEVLLGTRGSGKTVLLRMLSYSCLKLFAATAGNPEAIRIVEQKQFIGFYIPMHLEFSAALPDDKHNAELSRKVFSFYFNCLAATSLLDQVQILIEDCSETKTERLKRQVAIIEHLTKWWFPDDEKTFRDVGELREGIHHVFQTCEWDQIGVKSETRQLARPVLRPILNVLNGIASILGLNPDLTRWLACIDEAEFLNASHIEAINSFLRDEKRPLVVKMATLPFSHTSRGTLYPRIEAEGDDFSYNWIDMEWDSDDFVDVTNHICRVRLSNIPMKNEATWKTFVTSGTLADFVGRVAPNDEQIDYFRSEIKWSSAEWEEESVLGKIVSQLGDQRKRSFAAMNRSTKDSRQTILKRYRPIYFMREMKREQSKGNRSVGWFAGAETIRRIADGNPRIFIQVMNILLEASRTEKLTPKNQHRKLHDFCSRRNENAQGLPEHGVVIKALFDSIASQLALRVHGKCMLDSGCHFTVSDSLLCDKVIHDSLKVAIAYSYLRILDLGNVQFTGLTSLTDFRLGYSYAIEHWLPYRKGEPICIRSKEHLLDLENQNAPTTKKEADQLLQQLRIQFDDK